MKVASCLIATSFVFFVSALVFADTVTLKNGGKMHGKVIEESEEEIVLRVADAGTITLRKRDIASVQKDKKDETIPPPSQLPEEEKPSPPKEKPSEKPPEKEKPAPEETPKTEEEPEADPELKAKIDLLIFRLGHRRTGYESGAKAGLSKIGKPAVTALVKILKDGSDQQRRNAAELLGTISDKRAIEPLINALSDPNKWVRQHAINSLSTLTNQTLGFVYDASEAKRQEAVKKWQEWLAKKKEEEAKKKEEEKKKSEETKPESPSSE
jgi:hypothetical protein